MKNLSLLVCLVTLAFVSCKTEKAAPETDDIALIENGLLAAVQVEGQELETYTLEERMEHYNVPGLSIAIIDEGKLKWAKGYGDANTATGTKVTPETLFQAGHDLLVAGGAEAIAQNDLRGAVARRPARRRRRGRHGVTVNQQGPAELLVRFGEKVMQGRVVGNIEFAHSPFRILPGQKFGIDVEMFADDTRNGAQAASNPHGGRVDEMRQLVGKHLLVEFPRFPVHVQVSTGEIRRQ